MCVRVGTTTAVMGVASAVYLRCGDWQACDRGGGDGRGGDGKDAHTGNDGATSRRRHLQVRG